MKTVHISITAILVVFLFVYPNDAFGCVMIYDPMDDFLPWFTIINSDCSTFFYVPSIAGIIYGVVIGVPILLFIRKRK